MCLILNTTTWTANLKSSMENMADSLMCSASPRLLICHSWIQLAHNHRGILTWIRLADPVPSLRYTGDRVTSVEFVCRVCISAAILYNVSCETAPASTLSLFHDISVLQSPCQSLDLKPIGDLEDVMQWGIHSIKVHLKDLQGTEPCSHVHMDPNCKRKCFRLLLESMLQRFEAALKGNIGQTQYHYLVLCYIRI